MSEQRDEFATERRETIIEALSWWEDEDGRWGHEKARDVLAAHEDEWCSVPARAEERERIAQAIIRRARNGGPLTVDGAARIAREV